MIHNFRKKIIVVVFLALLLSIFDKNVFSNPVSNNFKSDSIKVFSLCDSARTSIENFDISLNYASSANEIAHNINCSSCITESEFNLGKILLKYSKYDSSISHFITALDIYIPKDKHDRIIETLEYLNSAYIATNDFHKAIDVAKRGLKYTNTPDMDTSRARFYLNMGSSYYELGLYKKATDALMIALNIFEANNDSLGISSALINLGMIFSSNGNYSDALEYNFRALEISTNLNIKTRISVCLNNLGSVYSQLNENKMALKYFVQTLEIDTELKDTFGIAISYNNIGDTYKDLGDTVLAINYYLKSLEIETADNSGLSSVTYYNLGDIYLNQGDFKLALSYAVNSLAAAKSSGATRYLLDSYKLLHNLHSAMGNYEDAYNYLIVHKTLHDSIFEITKSKQIQDIKSRYTFEKQKSEIHELKEKSSSETKQNTYLTRIIIIISTLIAILIIIIVFIRRSKRLVNKQKLYYEKLLDRSEDFIFVVGTDGMTKYISPSYERKIGRETQNRIGKSAFEFIHPDDIEFVKKEFAMLMKDSLARNIEFRFKDAANNWIDVYAYGQNLIDDGMIDGILVNFWDVSERNKNENIIKQSELKFRQIFNAFPDIYFQANNKGVITEISPSVFKLTGFKRKEMLEVGASEYYNRVSDWETIRDELIANSNVHDFDTQIIKKDGSIIDCSLSAEIIYSQNDNAIAGIEGVIRDISSRIKSQKELRQSEKKLKEANNSKEKLFSIISHDLIGPIGTNKTIVDLIVGQIDDLTNEEIVSLISSLKPSLDSTFSLIENLLSWARIQQNELKPNLEKVSLNLLFEEMITLMNNQAKRKAISITTNYNHSVNVMADKNQLDIVFRNLVSNAIKFSNNGGEIIINLDSSNDFAVIKISDSGMGMNQKQIDSILSGKGSEVKRGTDNEKGTGFGLVIVNEFIKNNNGVLSINSKEGKGTTFTISIPITITQG